MTRIIGCICKHEFQDRTYGAGKRLHNYDGAAPVCGAKKDRRK